jgi:Domain of unknown function (DUF4234)
LLPALFERVLHYLEIGQPDTGGARQSGTPFDGAEYVMNEQSPQARYGSPPSVPQNTYAAPPPDMAEPPVLAEPSVPVAQSAFPAPVADSYQAQAPVATGLAMKARNPWLVWLVWPFITLGIYHLVWYYKIHKEMAEFDRRRAVPVAGPMLVLLFLSWTLIAPLISYYNCGNRIASTQRSAGLQPTCSPVIGLLLMFVFGSGTVYYQFELNRVVDVYQVEPGRQVPLYS